MGTEVTLPEPAPLGRPQHTTEREPEAATGRRFRIFSNLSKIHRSFPVFTIWTSINAI